jgi:serine protease Do
VVLTAYSQTGSFYFGESNLAEVGGSTGIVMSEDGYIITNRHCVVNESTGKNYDRIDVTTYDGTVYENATIVGTDQATDLAVIRVNATGLTPAQFGDSDELAVGARVVALGNAAGLSWTATQGIVSAKARDVYDDTGYAIKCLQVDLAINYGNSGGPLLNKQGLVVGINSAKIAASGYEGLGFSIPINEAKVIIDSLLKYGYVKGRVALGITGQTISSGMYKGFMIVSITDNSCLKGTDARVQDLIVEVDGVTVTDYGTLRAELAKHQVGEKVKLKLLRSDTRTGKVSSLYVTVTLKEQTAE